MSRSPGNSVIEEITNYFSVHYHKILGGSKRKSDIITSDIRHSFYIQREANEIPKSHHPKISNDYYGTGSYPCPPQGWQRPTLLMVSHNPLNTPYFLNASKA
jgi:hypothetical protein